MHTCDLVRLQAYSRDPDRPRPCPQFAGPSVGLLNGVESTWGIKWCREILAGVLPRLRTQPTTKKGLSPALGI